VAEESHTAAKALHEVDNIVKKSTDHETPGMRQGGGIANIRCKALEDVAGEYLAASKAHSTVIDDALKAISKGGNKSDEVFKDSVNTSSGGIVSTSGAATKASENTKATYSQVIEEGHEADDANAATSCVTKSLMASAGISQKQHNDESTGLQDGAEAAAVPEVDNARPQVPHPIPAGVAVPPVLRNKNVPRLTNSDGIGLLLFRYHDKPPGLTVFEICYALDPGHNNSDFRGRN